MKTFACYITDKRYMLNDFGLMPDDDNNTKVDIEAES